MFSNPKNVFWQAFLVTATVFILGLLLGVAFESSRLDKINEYYSRSDISLMDSFAMDNLIDLDNVSCEDLTKSTINFADKIYSEAVELEYYERSESISDNLILVHKKYDVLRTLLWINAIKIKERCGDNFHTIVYLYEYETEDLNKKAVQSVWSKILGDVKGEYGEEVILIPLAGNLDITSLEYLKSTYNITSLPAVIIDEGEVIYDLVSSDEIKRYLK